MASLQLQSSLSFSVLPFLVRSTNFLPLTGRFKVSGLPALRSATSSTFANRLIGTFSSIFSTPAFPKFFHVENLKTIKESEEFSDGPPCLQSLAVTKIPQGQRNEGLFALGVYARLKFGENWESEVTEYNRLYVEPPLPFKEVGQVIKSLYEMHNICAVKECYESALDNQ